MCHPGQSKEKFTAYANEKSKKVLQRYNLKCWVIIGVSEYFAPLNKIYGIPASFFHCLAQLSRSDHFWIFNGDRLLMTLERYGFKKSLIQFLGAKMIRRRVLSKLLWENSGGLITYRILFHRGITVLAGLNRSLQISDTRGGKILVYNGSAKYINLQQVTTW